MHVLDHCKHLLASSETEKVIGERNDGAFLLLPRTQIERDIFAGQRNRQQGCEERHDLIAIAAGSGYQPLQFIKFLLRRFVWAMESGALELLNDRMEGAAPEVGMALKSQFDMRITGYSLAEV